MLNRMFIFFLIFSFLTLESSYAQEPSDEVSRQRIKKLLQDEIFSTQREAATILRVGPSTLSGFLKGKTSPKIRKNLKNLCDNLSSNDMRLMSVVRHILYTQINDNNDNQLTKIAASLGIRSPTLKRFISGEFSKKILDQFRQIYPEIFLWTSNPQSEQYAYHLTPSSNVVSIAESGLVPEKSGTGFLSHGSAKIMSEMQGRAKGRVFFTNNYNNILRYQHHFKDKELVVLRIPLASMRNMTKDQDDPGSFSVDPTIQKNDIAILTLPNNVLKLDEHLIDQNAYWMPIANHTENHRYLRDIATGLWFFLSDNS